MANRQHDQIQWVRTGDPATVDDTINRYPGQLGGVYTDDAARQWQYVQGDSGMSVAPFPAAAMWWSSKANFLVTTDPTNRRGLYVGVVARRDRVGNELSAAPGKGNFFFVQKGGKAIVKTLDAVTAAPTNTGQVVIPSATAGKADVLAAGTGATYPPVGRELGWYNVAARELWVDLDNSDRED
jgi:hypothetical protein